MFYDTLNKTCIIGVQALLFCRIYRNLTVVGLMKILAEISSSCYNNIDIVYIFKER